MHSHLALYKYLFEKILSRAQVILLNFSCVAHLYFLIIYWALYSRCTLSIFAYIQAQEITLATYAASLLYMFLFAE